MVTDYEPDADTPSEHDLQDVRAALRAAITHPVRTRILTANVALARRRAEALPAPTYLSNMMLSILLVAPHGVVSYHVERLTETDALLPVGGRQRHGSFEWYYTPHPQVLKLLPDLFALVAPDEQTFLSQMSGDPLVDEYEERWRQATNRWDGDLQVGPGRKPGSG